MGTIQGENIADFSFLTDGKKKHVAILCHDQPDPDCLATAMAVAKSVGSMGIEGTIYYGGEITHTQTRVMVNVLNMPVVKMDSEDDSAEAIKEALKDSYLIVVDTANFRKENCQTIAAFVEKDRQPDMVIDHHALNPSISVPYIHYHYGACATIAYKILQKQKIEVDRVLATALYLGIMTDTDDLHAEGTEEEDRKAAEELKQLIDPSLYLKIFDYRKPLALLQLRSQVYKTIEVKDNVATAQVGVVNTQQRAMLGELCDEILEIEAIDTAVVLGLEDEGEGQDKYLVASFRSRALSIDTKDFIQRVFGKKNGGGRKGCGAAKIMLDEPTSQTLDWFAANEENKERGETFVSSLFEYYKEKIRSERAKL